MDPRLEAVVIDHLPDMETHTAAALRQETEDLAAECGQDAIAFDNGRPVIAVAPSYGAEAQAEDPVAEARRETIHRLLQLLTDGRPTVAEAGEVVYALAYAIDGCGGRFKTQRSFATFIGKSESSVSTLLSQIRRRARLLASTSAE